jgi:biopolymer transport protein ExbD
VSIDANSQVFIDKRAVALTALEPELKDLVSHDPDLALSLQADEGVPYRAVAKVIANIQRSGVSKLSVLTQPGG